MKNYLRPLLLNTLNSIFDMLLAGSCWLIAFWIRFNLNSIPLRYWDTAQKHVWAVIVSAFIVHLLFRTYRIHWRYISFSDAIKLLQACIISALLSFVVLYLLQPTPVPRSIPIIFLLLYPLASVGCRAVVRLMLHERPSLFPAKGKRILIIGAGSAGENLVRELKQEHRGRYQPIGFIDDAKWLRGRQLQGISVLGTMAELPKIVKRYRIEMILIAMPGSNSQVFRQIVEQCEQTTVPLRTLPSLDALADGRVSISQIREVALEDLLGREPVALDNEAVSNVVHHKTVLVTGGAGSIGSELVLQLLKYHPHHLIILDHNEFGLYSTEQHLQKIASRYSQTHLSFVLASITDATAINATLAHYKPDIIFHAAAYKHVPLLESQASTAIKNNVLGTHIVAAAAVAHEVRRFVLVSTDKAVNPTNVMGASKHLAELLCSAFNQQQNTTQFITVRFGNVLGSNGSVIPLFKQQIQQGGPLTVTHPETTRYFMTIPEAAQLILQAASMGKGGEIYVLDMGEPIRIQYLAEQLIYLSGLKLGEDIIIEHTGLRAGERLHEALFHDFEALLPTAHRKIFLAQQQVVDGQHLLDNIVQIANTAQNVSDLQRIMQLSQNVIPLNAIHQAAS